MQVEARRAFRRIWHHLVYSSERRFPLYRNQPNVLILQMGKVASTSIRSALFRRKINALHTHGLSPKRQHNALTHLLEANPTLLLASHGFRGHIHSVMLHAMIRWYQRHKKYRGHGLKVITLTRDPVTRYPSAFLHRRDGVMPAIIAWYRSTHGLQSEVSVDEAQALGSFVMECAAIIAEGRPSAGPAGCDRCIALANERWPDQPIVAKEVKHWLMPLSWFDFEIAPLFGIDVLALPELREQGWAMRSSNGVEILVLKFEELPSLVPEIQRFLGLAELTLPQRNLARAKTGATIVLGAVQSMMKTSVGSACAHELRTSPYGRACGYDRTA